MGKQGDNFTHNGEVLCTSPDCVANKHRACDGKAWNYVEDVPATCSCACHPVWTP